MAEINMTTNFNITDFSYLNMGPREYTYQVHLLGMGEIFFIIAVFIGLAWGYVVVTKNKEKYEKWINPNGKEINLYKVMRRAFWAYVITIIVFGVLLIYTAPR